MAAQGNYSQASYNDAVDFWRYDIGVNVIPADTANKRPLVSWSEWQDKPIPEEVIQSMEIKRRVFKRDSHYSWENLA